MSEQENQITPASESQELQPAPTVPLEPEAEEDFCEARATYKELINKGKDALTTAMNIIDSSEHPRAVEVFSGLIRSISDINDKLVELQIKKQELRKGRIGQIGQRQIVPQIQGNITQNNFTFGSTQDILNAIKELDTKSIVEEENIDEIITIKSDDEE